MVAYAIVGCTAAPQATLLYWLSNNAFFLGMQNALARPSVVKALGLPAVMLPHPKHNKDARGGSGSGVRAWNIHTPGYTGTPGRVVCVDDQVLQCAACAECVARQAGDIFAQQSA